MTAAAATAATLDIHDACTAGGTRTDTTQGRAEHTACRQLAPYGDAVHRHAAVWEQDQTLQVEVVSPGRWNAVAFWFQLDMGGGAPTLSSLQTAAGGNGIGEDAVGASWQQSVQYLDGRTVAAVRLISE